MTLIWIFCIICITFDAYDESTTTSKHYVLATQNEDGTWTSSDKEIGELPKTAANLGYENGSWNNGLTENTKVVDGSKYVYTFVAEARNITVNYVMDNDNKTPIADAVTINTEYNAGYNVTEYKRDAIKVEGNNYVLDSIDGALTGTVTEDVVVTFVYSLDVEGEEGTPDKYEATVNFEVVNGKFTDESTTTSKHYVLATQNEDGTWTSSDKEIGELPKTTANHGYENGSWNNGLTENTKVVDGSKYLYTFVAEARNITVNYVMDDDNKTPIADAVTINTEYNAGYNVTEYKRDAIKVEGNNYVLDSIDGALTGTVTEDVVVTFVYSLDVEGEEGTPDKYEATVNFEVVNGKFTDESTTTSKHYVLATQNEDGTWTSSDKEIGELPKTTANHGYENGSWNNGLTENTKVVDGSKYLYTFVAEARNITVNYVMDNEGRTPIAKAETISTQFNKGYDVTEYKRDAIKFEGYNYVLDSIDGALTGTVTEDVVVTFVYSLDVEGEEGTPDKYEATVNFEVVNGKFTDESTTTSKHYVLATQNEDGTWTSSDKEIGNFLKQLQITVMKMVLGTMA